MAILFSKVSYHLGVRNLKACRILVNRVRGLGIPWRSHVCARDRLLGKWLLETQVGYKTKSP